jgi:hypothetical protein
VKIRAMARAGLTFVPDWHETAGLMHLSFSPGSDRHDAQIRDAAGRLAKPFCCHDLVRGEHHCRGDVERIKGVQPRPRRFALGKALECIAGLSARHDAGKEPLVDRHFGFVALVDRLGQHFEAKKDAGDKLALRTLDELDG